MKPRISRGADGWQVELPVFGFGAHPSIKAGFVSRDAAGAWLARRYTKGSAAAPIAERAGIVRSGHAARNVPMIIK